MKNKIVLCPMFYVICRWLVVFVLLLTSDIGLRTFNLLYSASTGTWSQIPKWVTGEGIALGNWANKSNTMTWNGSDWVVTISTSDETKAIYPGTSYQYRYNADWGGEIYYEQRNSIRTLSLPVLSNGTTYYKVSDEIYFEDAGGVIGYPNAGVFYVVNNWGRPDTPLPPNSLTGYFIAGSSVVSLSWANPTYGAQGKPILDLFGGKYQVWRSTYSTTAGTNTFTLINSVLYPCATYQDTTVDLSVASTYYYAVRSEDAYISTISSSTYPDYSNWTSVLSIYAAQAVSQVTVKFTLDVSYISGVQSVHIMGNFTTPQWDSGKLQLSNNGNGTYSVTHTNKILNGTGLQYKYILNGTSIEGDFLTSSKNREVTVNDDDGDGSVEFKDVWGMLTVRDPLPEALLSFEAVAGNTVMNLSWERDLTKATTSYKIYRGEASYQLVAVITSTQTTYQDTGLTDGVAYNYKISVVDSQGIESGRSDPLATQPPNQGASLNYLNNISLLTDIAGVADLKTEVGKETGEITLRWTAPVAHPTYGSSHDYQIKYSTFPINTLTGFKLASSKYVTKKKAYYPGTNEYTTTINLGDLCPGFYFSVGSMYSSWTRITLSINAVGIAGKKINGGGLVKKGSFRFGSQDDNTKVDITVPKYAMPEPTVMFSIKNQNEIFNGINFKATQELLNVAKNNEVTLKRFGKIPEDTIFAFDAYDANGRNFFVDSNNDGAPERTTNLYLTLSIPYTDGNNNGIIDSTEGSTDPVDVNFLKVFRLNEKGKFWQPVKDGGETKVDKASKIIKVQVKHLSVYALGGAGKPAKDLSDVVVYPNPFVPYDNKDDNGTALSGITFTNLTKDAKIWVYNLAGELVRELFSNAVGEINWDATNMYSEHLASGVYIFLAKDEKADGVKKFTGKIAIVK